MIQMKNKMSFSWMSSKALSRPHHFWEVERQGWAQPMSKAID